MTRPQTGVLRSIEAIPIIFESIIDLALSYQNKLVIFHLCNPLLIYNANYPNLAIFNR